MPIFSKRMCWPGTSEYMEPRDTLLSGLALTCGAPKGT